MQEKLTIKYCPCCGGDAQLTAFLNGEGKWTVWIRCDKCGLTTAVYQDIEAAVAAWTKRVMEGADD